MALLFHCPWDNAADWLSALRRALPGEDIRVWPDVGDADEIDFAIVWELLALGIEPDKPTSLIFPIFGCPSPYRQYSGLTRC